MWGGIRIEHSSQHQLGAKSFNIQAVFHYAKEEHHELPSSFRAEAIGVPPYPGSIASGVLFERTPNVCRTIRTSGPTTKVGQEETWDRMKSGNLSLSHELVAAE